VWEEKKEIRAKWESESQEAVTILRKKIGEKRQTIPIGTPGDD